MPKLTLRQLEYETNSWKRLLSFMIDENIHLKNRLVEILKSVPEKNLLEEMENFHNRFIKQDDVISLLRNDVVELDKVLIKEIFEDGKMVDETASKLNKLRNNMSIAEMHFSKLKLEFNNYMGEILKGPEKNTSQITKVPA